MLRDKSECSPHAYREEERTTRHISPWRITARIDFHADGMMAGIFEATTGTVEVTYPFTEHATILEGKVTITDASGQSQRFGPIEQGQVVIWDVPGARVRKSFFNITRP